MNESIDTLRRRVRRLWPLAWRHLTRDPASPSAQRFVGQYGRAVWALRAAEEREQAELLADVRRLRAA